jgi:hypothetical protein
MFEVMMMIVFLKSTVRPWLSVRRPSSRICRSVLKTSTCAFSISSKRITRVGLAPHRLGELAALVVADVAGRRADEPRHGVLLHVLAHVEPDHVLLAVEHRFGQRAGQLGFAHAGRAEKNERADGPLRVLEAGAGADDRVGDGLHRLVLADDPLVQNGIEPQQLFLLALEQPRDGHAGPARDDLGDFVGGDFLLHQARAPLPSFTALAIFSSASLSAFSFCGRTPYGVRRRG